MLHAHSKQQQGRVMHKDDVAALRLPAIIIDLILIMGTVGLVQRYLVQYGWLEQHPPIEWIMFAVVPIGFFIYWALNINIGKRLFKLVIVDADTLEPATTRQLLKRSVLFCFLISFNILLAIPIFLSKTHQGFHDRLANTRVIRKPAGR
jgi:uncharacterized RDD family membrane protein YckC